MSKDTNEPSMTIYIIAGILTLGIIFLFIFAMFKAGSELGGMLEDKMNKCRSEGVTTVTSCLNYITE